MNEAMIKIVLPSGMELELTPAEVKQLSAILQELQGNVPAVQQVWYPLIPSKDTTGHWQPTWKWMDDDLSNQPLCSYTSAETGTGRRQSPCSCTSAETGTGGKQ